MKKNGFLVLAVVPVMLVFSPKTAFCQIQGSTIQASIRGSSGGDGKCTFEVEVDQVAEVEIRGGMGYIRTLSGSPAVWRRLVCNAPMPANPTNFRFKGIDGRGNQSLVQDPSNNGGTAVVHIEDPKAGREGFTGDLTWSGGGSYNYNQNNPNYNQNNPTYNQNNGSWNNGNNPNWGGNSNGNGNGSWNNGGWNHNGTGGWNNNGQSISIGDAMNICQNEVSNQSGAPRDDVRVDSSGNNSNRGSYTVNFQIRQRGNRGNAVNGSCRISRNGQIEDIRH